MMTILAIGTGGFLGALFRYLLFQQLQSLFSPGFPYGTLVVNAFGSFLLGFLSRYWLHHPFLNEELRLGITVGILGAFTTFSTFSNETILLMQEGDFLKGGINVLSNVVICLILCFIGSELAKTL